MPTLQNLIARDSNKTPTSALTPTMINLLIALLVLVIVGILAIIALFVLRSRRTRQRCIVQQQAEKITSSPTASPLPATNTNPVRTHRHSRSRLTITASPYKPITSVSEKEILMGDSNNNSSNNNSQANSPSIPEIRITFPEEEDPESGKRKSGRVVVVTVSDMGSVGLEPTHQPEMDGMEWLPAYYAQTQEWKELDLELLGGLKEKSGRL